MIVTQQQRRRVETKPNSKSAVVAAALRSPCAQYGYTVPEEKHIYSCFYKASNLDAALDRAKAALER